jgi:hypothetical protein
MAARKKINKESKKTNNEFAFDKKSGISIHKDQLVKMFEDGEFVLREDIDKQKKEQRRKVPKTEINLTLIYFLDSFFHMQKGTINGAITDMLKRKDDGHYKFKSISNKIKTISMKNDDDRYKQEQDFIEAQVYKRYKNIEGVKLQVKLMFQEIELTDPDFSLLYGVSKEDIEKFPEIEDWFFN